MLRYPAPLQLGDRICVTAPSSGVPRPLRARLDVAVGHLRDRGYDVVVVGRRRPAAHRRAAAFVRVYFEWCSKSTAE